MLIKDSLVEVYPYDVANMDAKDIADIGPMWKQYSGSQTQYFVEARVWSDDGETLEVKTMKGRKKIILPWEDIYKVILKFDASDKTYSNKGEDTTFYGGNKMTPRNVAALKGQYYAYGIIGLGLVGIVIYYVRP